LFRYGIGAGSRWSGFAIGERPHWSGVGVEDSAGTAGSDDRLSVWVPSNERFCMASGKYKLYLKSNNVCQSF
jgi:hypothetical protein